MHGTLEQLRDRYPGKWLLIQLDEPEAEEGTVLAAHENPEVVDHELEKHFQPNMSRHKPLYVTYSVPEGQDLPAVALQLVPLPPVPGEAPLDPRETTMVVVRNVALSTFSDEVHVDAVIDTGATLCVVPPIFARQLGFDYSNRLGGGPVNVIGGSSVQMDIHRLEWVRVGSARAFDVRMGVAESFAGPGSRKMLVGLTFISQFRTTFDFDGGRVVFRRRR